MEQQEKSLIRRLVRRHGLRYVAVDQLMVERRTNKNKFSYHMPDGTPIRERSVLRRYAALAVPPAYHDVRLSEDETAHIQAVGRDDRGRLQYRYHPLWEEVRETRKARRLAGLVEVLPRVRKTLIETLSQPDYSKNFAVSAALLLIAESGIRPGGEAYLRGNGTRGATTLLKSDVRIRGSAVSLRFIAKGGQEVRKMFELEPLALALRHLKRLRGPRLFQYRDCGTVRCITAGDANLYLRTLAGRSICAKDFRTLCGCLTALDHLAELPADMPVRERRKQVAAAIRSAADALANTPAVCKKSYVHASIVEAAETGALSNAGRRRSAKRVLVELISSV